MSRITAYIRRNVAPRTKGPYALVGGFIALLMVAACTSGGNGDSAPVTSTNVVAEPSPAAPRNADASPTVLAEAPGGTTVTTAVSTIEPANGCDISIAFDHSVPPYDDPAFRQALALSINDSLISELILTEASFPLPDFSPKVMAALVIEEVEQFDLEMAKRILATSRYASPETRPEPVVENPTWSSPELDNYTFALQAAVHIWREELGIDVVVLSRSTDSLLEPGFSEPRIRSFSGGELPPALLFIDCQR